MIIGKKKRLEITVISLENIVVRLIIIVISFMKNQDYYQLIVNNIYLMNVNL